MNAQPQFLLLNQHMGWHQASVKNVSAGADLALRGHPDGPLGLTNPDGSLGHLTLPRGLALAADGTAFLIPTDDPTRVLRYDVKNNLFVPVPGIGGIGRDARNIPSANNLAIAGKPHTQLLYIVDTGNARVQVFHLKSLALLHSFCLPGWQAVDVAAWEDWAFILFRDRERQRVYRHHVSGAQLEGICEAAVPARWERIAMDREGRIYLLNLDEAGQATLDVFTLEGSRCNHENRSTGSWEHFSDSGAVSARFDPPAVTVQSDPRASSPYHRGIFQLTLRGCQPEAWAARDENDSWFDLNGELVEFHPDQFLEPRAYYSSGEWTSQPLDSQRFRCQWHRIELLMSAFPSGTRLTISTLSSLDPTLPVNPLWQKSYEAAGTSSALTSALTSASTEFLVQSRPGQYLWLKIEISGDGYGSPKIRGMRVHFPRQSYLAHLPAVYSEENSRWFLERFLSIFQTDWDELETRISRFAALFDPAAVNSADGSLQNLASWLAIPLEGEWNEDQQRQLLQAVAKYYPRRGTQAGLRTFVQAYLQNMTSLPPEWQAGFPIFIEGFRRRALQSFLLGHSEGPDPSGSQAQEGHPTPAAQPETSFRPGLWGLGKVGRLQLNRYSTAGEARLVSTGDPQFDVFHAYAHRFEVFVPSAWISTVDDERRLRRALDAEKPAQTAYELFLVEPSFRVGIQSTIGVDTILGGVPSFVLADSSGKAAEILPPSRAPSGRLGFDSVLASRPGTLPTLPLGADVPQLS